MDDLTKKQREFVKEYLDTGNGVQSALKVYDTTSYKTASNIASENLDKPRVIAFLESVAEQVASNMHRLAISAESEQVQLGAGKDVLDRAGYKPVDKQEVKQETTFKGITDEEKMALHKLIHNEPTSTN